MGSIVSRKSDKELIDLLLNFTGKDPIPQEDGNFWTTLLSFNVSVATEVDQDQQVFEQAKQLCNHLNFNNSKTGNFGTLLHIFLDKISILLSCNSNSPELEKATLEAQNSLFIIRIFLQYCVQKHPEHELNKHLNVKGIPKSHLKSDDSESMMVVLTNTILDALIHIPLNQLSYSLHCEATNSLLVLLSSHLFTTLNPGELEIYRIIYEYKDAEGLCRVLIKRFVEQPKCPKDNGGSLLIGLASDLLGLFVSTNQNSCSPIAVKSLLLYAVLVNHNAGKQNLYKDCLFSVTDLENVYNSVCSQLHREETTLLLYHLVHKNSHFRTYLLGRPDIDCLVAPMLQTIYFASSDSCPHMYLSLIVLLILTEDATFNKRVHSIVLKNITWYADRTLTELSLGGLLILVTTRAVQYNLLKMRDEYLHTNCLAALANMSSQFTDLHPYVCQRLVGLFEILAKTYSIAKEELVAIERALRIILEVINSCLSNQLTHNPNLVYTLLYKKQIFEAFREHSAFQDIIQNIDQVLQYFVTKIEQEQEASLDVDEVLSIIKKSASLLPSHRLQKFPELKFKYVEEENPDEFFIPYVWSLISKYSCIYWQSSLIC